MTRGARGILIVCAVVLLLLLVGVGAWMVSASLDTTRDAYAVWWVADMVIEYMDTHDGAWPRGWEDLREPYTTLTVRSGRPRTFEDLRSRVDVDWNVEPRILVEAASLGQGPPIVVIRLRSGKTTHWSGREPNEMILSYLVLKHAEAASAPAK